MAYKRTQRWIHPTTGAEVTEISGTGVWQEAPNDIRSDLPITMYFARGSGADPIGTVLTVGMRTRPGTPVQVAGASLTLPTLVNGQEALPVRFTPQGTVCVTVTTYVAPFIAEQVQ